MAHLEGGPFFVTRACCELLGRCSYRNWMHNRRPHPTDVSDEKWAFAAPYLSFMTEHALQRKYALRDMFNALRWMARAGAPWRRLPNDFPPWEAAYQQTQLWLQAGCFEAGAPRPE